MSHHLIKGATSREMAVVSRLTTAEGRADSPSVRSALSEGLELIRELISERGRRREFDDQVDDATADPFPYDPPCPEG